MHRLILTLALVAGFIVLSSALDLIFDLTRALIRSIGPVWALGVVGLLTVTLGWIWIRYGGTRALRRWGVTVIPQRPASQPGRELARDEDLSRDADVPGTAGRGGGSGSC